MRVSIRSALQNMFGLSTTNRSARKRKVRSEALESRLLLTTFYVDDDAVAGGDGSEANPFHTIQEAINQAASLVGDDTIAIHEGTYVENLIVVDGTGNLTFTGISGDRSTVVIKNPTQGEVLNDTVSILSSKDVLFSNLTVQAGDAKAQGGNIGIFYSNGLVGPESTGGLTVENVVVQGHNKAGILVEYSGDVNVSNSFLTRNHNGIYVDTGENVTLQDVTSVFNERDGAQIRFSDSLAIDGGAYDDNAIHGLFANDIVYLSLSNTSFNRNVDNGVDIRQSFFVDITDVIVNDNGYGNGLSNTIDGLLVTDAGARDLTLTRVTASNNSGAGMRLQGAMQTITATGLVGNDNGLQGIVVVNTDAAVEIDGGEFLRNTYQGMKLDQFNSATVNDVLVSGNNIKSNNQYAGGGILATSTIGQAPFVLTNSSILDNESAINGAGVFVGGRVAATIQDVLIQGNAATGVAQGGGVYVQAVESNSLISRSVIANNTAASGGGVAHVRPEVSEIGSLVIEDTWIKDNLGSVSGGGIYQINQNLRVNRSTISGNSTNSFFGGGGGIFVRGETKIENSTISGNYSESDGGGIAALNNPYSILVVYSTVTDNTAAGVGGGIHRAGTNNYFAMANSLVAGNSATEGSPDFDGAFTSTSYNLIGDGTGSSGANLSLDMVGTSRSPIDPLLAALGDNGGATPTHALLPGSPAINAVGRTNYIYREDQRLVPRPQGISTDIGAFELEVGPNTLPVAYDRQFSTPEEVSFSGSLFATDADGDSLTYQLVDGPEHFFAFGFFSSGNFNYVAKTDFFGTDSFTYRAYDGQGYSNVATVTITVLPVNDPPVAEDDVYQIQEDQTLNVTSPGITLPGILDNDFDVDLDVLTVSLVDDVAHGSLTLEPSGAFTYIPDENYNGTDRFTYLVDDGNGAQDVASVVINIAPVNDPPVAFDDSFNVSEDETLNVSALGVLANDTDADADDLTVALIDDVMHGTLTLNTDGSFAYVPDPNYNGSDSFTYQAADSRGVVSNTATVFLQVDVVNDLPEISAQSFSLPENTANGEFAGQVEATDIDGDLLEFTFIDGNQSGAFAIAANGTITVADSTQLDFEQTPQFDLTVEVSDGTGSASALLQISLTDVQETLNPSIDIQPGDINNAIIDGKNSTVEVAIFGSSTFDASQIDVATLRFGETGTEDSLRLKGKKQTPDVRYEDINGDGYLDLIAVFETNLTGLSSNSTDATISGYLFDGQDFLTTDLVTFTTSGGNGGGNGGGKGGGKNK